MKQRPVNGQRMDVYSGATRAGSIAQRQKGWVAVAVGGRQLGEFPDRAGAMRAVLADAKKSEGAQR